MIKRIVVSVAGVLLFALIFKILPDVKLEWKDVWVGGAVTSALFTMGKFIIGLYLGQSAVASAYGASGSLVVVMIWTYYSALILFFGAELTRVLKFPGRSPMLGSPHATNHPHRRR